ncbi:hypothetical protein CAPTEDRAFT_227847 [Capitella teleta]|uniref:Unconventional myosin-XV n=1 Tax=Capitella teleta TaxID=283909 RepID=R7U7V2_CAPTE|nr:hypothetical protein CAPTEDRAFT_227847 [Capitella teleta]|eukprot:ELU02236.1 hypothetical protein CAPTEDRAFT_227847 [Capitella teleta]
MTKAEDDDNLGEDGIEDMILLHNLTEEKLQENIRLRYSRDLIYTFTGSILVAVNPYKNFNIYGLDVVKRYEGKTLGSLPPHLFALGSASFGRMIKDSENQVIVISGESGAGKTESTKLLMQYLAAVNKSGSNLVTERILQANPLLESFGNAKTIRNDNSSRFGKYAELYFKGGSITGAKISEYLLEKSRIVTQAADERNYHIFYEMLSALNDSEKAKYGLQTAEKYFYLNRGGNCEIDSKDDLRDFGDLRSAMDVLGFTSTEKDTIMRILASVLHLGNVYFNKVQNEHHNEGVEVGSDAEIKWISHLLHLSEKWLKEALTMKVMEARSERLLTPLTIDQALDARDAIAKALYQRLFSWLVERVNHIVKGPEVRERTNSIAILDIFGFEDFRVNSFEQLCINYANESLQFYFNKHVFSLEQAEYTKEQIIWSKINFHDNQPVIDLISKKPNGILLVLDDESNFPKSTDQSFLEKINFLHANSEFYEKPRMSSPEFLVRHYAGTVTYHMIATMFRELRDKTVTKTISKVSGSIVTMKPKTSTVAAGFHESLLSLTDLMSKCHPWFVRCLKPNNHKAAMLFDKEVVLQQLRYTGMLETIQIRKMGYPVRFRFHTFANRYFLLLKSKQRHPNGNRHADDALCRSVLKSSPEDSWQMGMTKVFLKESLGFQLEELRNNVLKEAVLKLQQYTRGLLQRKRYQKTRKAAIVVQNAARMWLARAKFAKLRQGIIQAQAQYRMLLQRRVYQQMLHEQRERKKVASQPKRKESQLTSAVSVPVARKESSRSLSNMEMPKELDHVFRKLGTWQPIHTERHVVSAGSNVTPIDLSLSMPDDINAYALSKYINIYYQDLPFRYKKGPITRAFLAKGTSQDARNAIEVFKLILCFINDTTLSPKAEKALADYIAQQGMSHEVLRDEIYVQLCNQTLGCKKTAERERGWLLMAHCLSCFAPTSTLATFLLKYVSDNGFRSYQSVCQMKLLQSLNLNASRTYPPCLLEWKTTQSNTCMGLEAFFADGEKNTAQVESWTFGEDFAGNLLQAKGIHEGRHGWAVVLRDETDTYECSGHEYVLDLISEMEVPPSFPFSKAYFLVSSDRSHEMSDARRKFFQDTPHDPDLPRNMLLGVDELSEPVPVLPRPPQPAESFFNYDTLNGERNYAARDEALSKTSNLNRRRDDLQNPNLSASSMLNVRYVRRPPASSSGTSPGISPQQPALATTSRMNKRYTNGEQAANKVPQQVEAKSPTDKNARRHRSHDDAQSHTSDMDQWLDTVFDSALDHDVADLQDARALQTRLRGGGEEPQPPPVATFNSTIPQMFSGPATGNISLGSLQMAPDPNQNILDGPLSPQQFAQQKALSFKAQLQAQSLENQLLQETMHGEVLKSQLRHLQESNTKHSGPHPITSTVPLSPVTMAASTKPVVPSTNTMPNNQQQDLAPGEVDGRHPGGVNTLKMAYEHKSPPPVTDNHFAVSPTSTVQVESPRVTSPVTVIAVNNPPAPQSPPRMVSSPPAAPPPLPSVINRPPLNQAFLNGDDHNLPFKVTGSPSAAVPPAPPAPAPPITRATSSSGEPAVITTKSGKARTVRIGKIQWPPVKEETQKAPITVGKLDITEAQRKQEEEIRGRKAAEVKDRLNQIIQDAQDKPKSPDKKKLFTPLVVAPAVSRPRPPIEDLPDNINMDARKKALESQLSSLPRQKPLERKPSAKPLPIPPLAHPPPVMIPASSVPVIPPLEVEVEDEEPDLSVDLKALEHIQTALFGQNKGPFYTYSPVPWTLEVRKEVFTPTEQIENPAVLNLIFAQVVMDVFATACLRIRKEDRLKMRSTLEHHGISPRNVLDKHREQTKRFIVDSARDWPFYFSRLYPVNGGKKMPNVHMLAIGHSGVRLLTRQRDVASDTLTVQDLYDYDDIIDISVPRKGALQIHVNGRYVIVYTPRAPEARQLIEAFCIESERDVMYVKATRNYRTRESTLLSFARGDVIKLTNKDMTLDRGWLYGSLHGRAGMFPAEYVTPLPKHAVSPSKVSSDSPKPEPAEEPSIHSNGSHADMNIQQADAISFVGEMPNFDHYKKREAPPSVASSTTNSADLREMHPGGKFSMLEFAMLHFRESPYRYNMKRSDETGSIHGTFQVISSLKAKDLERKSKGSQDWTWKQQVDMIKWTQSPIQASLLKFESTKMNKLSLECFIAIMQYMGDYPLSKGQRPMDCAYSLMMVCHNHPELRDEAYCQLIKQTTNNRSAKLESAQQGWRLMAIFTCYFGCSEVLKPYLLKYLESTAQSKEQAHNIIAQSCLHNLRQTFKYGGRKNVPSRDELQALTVVGDAVDHICNNLSINAPLERDEHSIFYVIENDNRYCPLSREEYLFDITTELENHKKPFYLLFQRTSWVFPLHLSGNNLYIDVMYHQSLPDYLDGFLLVLKSNSLPPHEKDDVAYLGALQLRAADKTSLPQQRDIKFVIPRNCHNLDDMRIPQWTNAVQDQLRFISNLSTMECKLKFIEMISKWPFYGSTFFHIRAVSDLQTKTETLLVVNSRGIFVLHSKTHETLLFLSLLEILSTRCTKTEVGVPCLDIKYGDLMKQKITRLETEQSSDIESLLSQYISITNALKTFVAGWLRTKPLINIDCISSTTVETCIARSTTSEMSKKDHLPPQTGSFKSSDSALLSALQGNTYSQISSMNPLRKEEDPYMVVGPYTEEVFLDDEEEVVYTGWFPFSISLFVAIVY